MFAHILIPTDGSELSQRHIAQAMQFAKQIGARVTGLTVSEPFHVISADPMMVTDTEEAYRADCESRARRYLDAITNAAKTAEVDCQTVHVFAEHPYEAIIQNAQKKECDVICMASHGRRGMQALVLGSETTKVLTHTKIPVLVWR